ncbi:MAG: recombination mediator RecR [Leptospirillia bacterium]
MKRKGVFEGLIGELARLPSIGRKNAQRLAYAIMRLEPDRARRLGQTIIDARASAHPCARCHNVTDAELCEICTNPRRDSSRMIVVEDPGTLYQIERTGTFRGIYHVLAGVLSPLEQIGPEALDLDSLLMRLKEGDVHEVILATSPTVEGEATALYITREVKPLGVKVSRIAYGVPVGMDLEYADEVSLIKSIEGRHAL